MNQLALITLAARTAIGWALIVLFDCARYWLDARDNERDCLADAYGDVPHIPSGICNVHNEGVNQ